MQAAPPDLALAPSPTPIRTGYMPRGYWLTPLIAIMLFIGMMGGILWWLNDQEYLLRRDNLLRDVETTQQTLRIRLLSNQDALATMARDLAARQLDETSFSAQATELMSAHREIAAISFLDEDRIVRWHTAAPQLAGTGFRPIGEPVQEPESFWGFDLARDDRRSAYTRPFLAPNSDVFWEVLVPVFRGPRFSGVIVGTYSVAQMLQVMVPADIRKKYMVTIVDEGGNHLIANPNVSLDATALSHELVLDPPGYGMYLRAYTYSTRPQFAENLLFWLVFALSAFIVWSLFVVWRHMRQRAFAEQALVHETNFRRAMENSILTGMRAIDMQGRITYVNAAFCNMTGFDESDFLGHIPPYRYWPPDRVDESQANLELVLSGNAPPEGLEVLIQRKDGSRFDARMYVSPLIDERGIQTGWMTSITDITEPKRVRENLAATHSRFTTVLEGLDAAVSVYAGPSDGSGGELLFANRYYRQLFGHHVRGHLALTGDASGDHSDLHAREVFLATLGKWFEVRSRRVEWVDGRRVTMLIATDITARRDAEEMTRQQEEKVALTSRLITMGEMASSIAHELNQPLTAITNYSMGTLARLRGASAGGPLVDIEDILPALEKTSQQAQRAGAIIRRIREFVKRSEPRRRMTDLHTVIDDALGLVGFDATKRGARVVLDIADDMPMVPVDPIMIEQVLINLMRNGIEAMNDANDRTLTVRAHRVPGYAAIDVIDLGTGLGEEGLKRLFEPFHSTKTEGMGMGLNICRSIIEFHQGRLWADNNVPGPGCTFHVLLPIGKLAAAPDTP